MAAAWVIVLVPAKWSFGAEHISTHVSVVMRRADYKKEKLTVFIYLT